MFVFLHTGIAPANPGPSLSIRCPACRQIGRFENLPGVVDAAMSNPSQSYSFGQRMCPNPDCRVHLFFIWDTKAKGGGVN